MATSFPPFWLIVCHYPFSFYQRVGESKSKRYNEVEVESNQMEELWTGSSHCWQYPVFSSCGSLSFPASKAEPEAPARASWARRSRPIRNRSNNGARMSNHKAPALS